MRIQGIQKCFSIATPIFLCILVVGIIIAAHLTTLDDAIVTITALSSAGRVDASDATQIPRIDQVKNDEREIQGSISYKFIRPTSEWTVLHFIFYELIQLSL